MKTVGDLLDELGTLPVDTPLRVIVRKGVMDAIKGFRVINSKLVLVPENPLDDRREVQEPL